MLHGVIRSSGCPGEEGQRLFFFYAPLHRCCQLCSQEFCCKGKKKDSNGKKKCSINKERQRERGGRDGNGKKDEVSPMGEACADLLNPSNLLHLLLTSFLHRFSFQGEATRGEIRKEERVWEGKGWHQEKERSGVKQMTVCFHRKEQESMSLELTEDLRGEDVLLRLLWPVPVGHPWALGRSDAERAAARCIIRHNKNLSCIGSWKWSLCFNPFLIIPAKWCDSQRVGAHWWCSGELRVFRMIQSK